jgi:hypothetical protein
MQLMDIINSAGAMGAIAQQVGLSESDAKSAATALLPALVGGMKKRASTGGGAEGIASMLATAGGGSLFDNVVSPEPTQIDLGNQLLGQIFGSKDVSRNVAAKAAQDTGLDAGALKKLLPLLAMVAGGLMSKQSGQGDLLGKLSSALGSGGKGGAAGLGELLDLDADGNPLDDMLEMAGKLFRR